MSVTSDTIYLAGWQTLDRVRPLGTFDPNTAIGSAFWNLNNTLQIARGDANVGGTPVSDAQRTAILDLNGNLTALARSDVVKFINALVAAYPPATTITPIPGATGTTPAPAAGFLGLPATIFGIDSKIVIIGAVAAFFLMKD